MKKRYSYYLKNWFRLGLIAALATSFSLNLAAQTAPVKQWDKTFGGSSLELLYTLRQTSDGGYILGGSSFSGISGDKSQSSKGAFDYWIVKVDANGNKTWDKTFGGNQSDDLYSLQQTSDGGYILAGQSMSPISGDKSQPSQSPGQVDFWVVKTDANGNKIWDKTIGGNDNDWRPSIQQTSDGGYILGGTSASGISGDKTQASKGNEDYWVVKLDASGNKAWDKTLGGGFGDFLNSLQQTADGGYILGGSSSGAGGDKSQVSQGGPDYWVIKLDASGNKTWDKRFGGNRTDVLYSLQQTSDGGYILGGYSGSGITGDKTQLQIGGWDYWVVKLDASGNKSWDKTFGGSDDEILYSLQQTSDGGYIAGGHSKSGISGDKTQVCQGDDDYWVLKLNANGNKTWDKTFGGSGLDKLYSLRQTTDGGYIFAGSSNSGISGDKSQPSKGDIDFWVIKLAPDVLGVKEIEANFNLSIFPNPNQGKFNLQLSNLTASKAEVTISDLLGRVVFQQEFKATNNQLSEELTLPNAKGIYLLQLKTGSQISTHKIVVE